MESVSRAPLQRMKPTRGSIASSSSFSIKNPYDGVFLSRGGKAKFEPHEYAEIFSGSSSIPVLDLSGLNGQGGCRSSEIDYSNIFGGAKGEDVEVPYEQLVNGVHRKTKTRIPADAEFQARGSLNYLGKAKRFSGACAQGTEEIKQQFNMSFNKTNQRSGDESNGETHVAQLHAVPGFTHFVDGTPQLHKEEGYRHVPSVKPDVSRTWSFSSGIQEITTKGGLCSEKSHTPVKSWSVNGIHVTSHIPEVQPPLSQPSGPNDNKDIKQSSLPAFGSKETVDGNSPPLFDEELEENSDAAISVAALKKAIQQAQESISLAKMIMQKKGEGVKDVSRARRLKGRSKVEDKMENRTDHAPGGLKKKILKEEFLRLDPAFNGVEGKSATILSHSDNLHNAAKAKVETVRENFEAANSHGDAFPEIDKRFTSSCCQSESLKNDKNVEVENSRQDVAASEANGETINVTGLATVVLESEKVDSKYDLMCSKPKAVPCIEQMGTDRKALKQKQLTNQQESEVFSGRAESVADDSQIVQDLEESSNEAAVEQYQETIGPMKGLVYLTEQFERVLKYSSSMLEQAKITHEGGGYLRSSQETELPEGSETISDREKCEKKFAGRSELNNLQNESCGLAEKNMMDQEDIDKKLESVCEWKEDGQDGDRRDEDENGMTLNEETLWFESELQLEETMVEEMSEREPVIFPGVGEASNKVDMVLEPRIDVDKVKLEHEEDTRTVPTEHEDGIVNGCVDAAECEEVETLQVETNNYSESQNGEIPLDVEEINDTHRSAGRREEHQVPFEFRGSDSEKDTSDAFDVHSEDSGTIFSDNHGSNTRTILTETKETCDVDFNNTAEKYQAVLRGCEDDNSFLGETESFQKCASIEKFTEGHTFESFSSDSKCTSVALTNADNEKASLKDEDVLKTTVEIENTAQECDANACMQNLSELHGSTDNEVENLDKTNAEPDSQKKSENGGESQSSSNFETMEDISANESPACSEEEAKSDVDMNSDERVHVGQQSECLNSEDQSHLSQENCEVKEMDKSLEAEREIKTGHHMENLSRTSTTEQEDAKRNDQKFDKDDQMQRIEAIKRGRAREKDRIAAERVIREARERAFAEARERAERAAVERAAAEARQRVMEEVREKTGKASVETKPSADKASIEAKRRAERAAVERATAEARERAQKAMSQKTSMEARVQSAKYSTEQFPSSSRNNGLKHSFSSSDLEKVGGATSESALRSKARLERHERIMERAAKALAEKNSRDLLAQKEQAERNRLAESVDADIKRWATGKQGNLRALLSTLQYILGPDSGWQPVTLTEIITTAAVKKAYRKATLCVHPDKLQQRGATIQQKYTCEKIFDLLKAAWNKFNSEER